MRRLLAAAAVCLTPFAALADAHLAWSLDGEASKLSFGSVKKDTVGEVHHFSGLSGVVSADGEVAVEIDLASVETWIDIRNERMAKFVFEGMGPATLTANVDTAELEALAPGQSMVLDVEGALSLGGATVEIAAPVFVARLGEDRAMVATDELIFVSTEELGVNAGVDKLMEIAKLPSITRAVPVAFRLVFDKGEATAAAPAAVETAAAAPALGGDPKKGARVFKKCKACHVVDKEQNKVGPHLVGVMGRDVAAVDGFKYSKAMAALGGEWTVERMTEFLKKPRAYVKGTKMSFGGLKKDADIENVIAYMASPE